MFIISTLERLIADFSVARVHRQTERTIRSLPLELQKDIGWPDLIRKPGDNHPGVGSWTGSK